jgi:hypothetical protein
MFIYVDEYTKNTSLYGLVREEIFEAWNKKQRYHFASLAALNSRL